MAVLFQSWRPTKSEADLLIDMLKARIPEAKIAAFFISMFGRFVISCSGYRRRWTRHTLNRRHHRRSHRCGMRRRQGYELKPILIRREGMPDG